MSPKFFRNYADFERECIRPGMGVGQSVEDMIQDNPFEREFMLDRDPFEDEEDDDF